LRYVGVFDLASAIRALFSPSPALESGHRRCNRACGANHGEGLIAGGASTASKQMCQYRDRLDAESRLFCYFETRDQ
jgi:hypothetical protein